MKNPFYLALLIAVFGACKTPKPLSQQALSSSRFPDTLGVFENNVTLGDWQGASLWSALYFKSKADTSGWKNHRVKLILLSEELIKAELFGENSLLECVQIKGRLSANEFTLNRQHKYVPFIVVIAGYTAVDTKIALNENGDLVCENSRFGLLLAGSILPIFGAGGRADTTLYQKVRQFSRE